MPQERGAEVEFHRFKQLQYAGSDAFWNPRELWIGGTTNTAGMALLNQDLITIPELMGSLESHEERKSVLIYTYTYGIQIGKTYQYQ